MTADEFGKLKGWGIGVVDRVGDLIGGNVFAIISSLVSRADPDSSCRLASHFCLTIDQSNMIFPGDIWKPAELRLLPHPPLDVEIPEAGTISFVRSVLCP